jgi:hypothetical protein
VEFVKCQVNVCFVSEGQITLQAIVLFSHVVAGRNTFLFLVVNAGVFPYLLKLLKLFIIDEVGV